MKKHQFAIIALFFICISYAQETYDLTTLRIGPYKIYMKKEDAEKNSKSTLINFQDYNKRNHVKYQGEEIEIMLSEVFINEKEPNAVSVYLLSSKSPKYRTKSGMGVGNVRNDLIEAYKNYPNFSVYRGFTSDGKVSDKETFFELKDDAANTTLTFKMIDNLVTEVTVSINEGCD